ncbi:hypothetical protein HDA31_005738 [Micromonospora carbonacea subsp. aurantiaca]|nr:hypothetical protein [Micromonospora carbonacea]
MNINGRAFHSLRNAFEAALLGRPYSEGSMPQIYWQ